MQLYQTRPQQSHKNKTDVNLYTQSLTSLSQLQNTISLTNFQMLQLTLNQQKFMNKIEQLNQTALVLMESKKYEEALVYLGEAEKVLQYAAGRGCALDRQVILHVLNNMAVAYQKSEDMDKCLSYLQGMIFHLERFQESQQNKDIVNKMEQKVIKFSTSFNKVEVENFLENYYPKILSLLSNKFHLSLLYLQYSIFNSQSLNHSIALDYAQRAITSYQKAFQITLNLLILQKSNPHISTNKISQLFDFVTKLNKIPISECQESFLQSFQQIRTAFDKKLNVLTSFNYILQKYSSLQKKDKKYKEFSLNTVIELKCQSFKSNIQRQQKVTGNNIIQGIQNEDFLMEKMLEYSAAFFTASVCMREVSSQIQIYGSQENQSNKKRQQNETNAHKFHLISLKIAIQCTEQLSQFAQIIYKNYIEVYINSDPKLNEDSITRMNNLKAKYKNFITNGDSNIQELSQSYSFFNRTISEYNASMRTSIKPKEKQNMLDKFLKEDMNSTPQKINNPPPKLNIDVSQIESLQYGTSNTFTKNNKFQSHIKTNINQDVKEYDFMSVKKILTVPDISNLSSNKQSQLSSREKSQKQIKKLKQKERIINQHKKKKSKQSLHHVSPAYKDKFQIRRFLSPKNFIQKSTKKNFKTNQNHKKISQGEKLLLSDRKVLVKKQQSDSRNKNIFQSKKESRLSKYQIQSQISNKNISMKRQSKNYLQSPKQKKISFKLKKAKSFQEIHNPFQGIISIEFKQKNISKKDKDKVKLNRESKKTKSTQNIQFAAKIKTNLKRSSRKNEIQQIHESQKIEKKRIQAKESDQKGKKKSQMNMKQPKSSIAWPKNAIRMSSLSNLMQSANQKEALRKLKSSQSIRSSNSSIEYFLKQLNTHFSQRTKAESIRPTVTLRNQ